MKPPRQLTGRAPSKDQGAPSSPGAPRTVAPPFPVSLGHLIVTRITLRRQQIEASFTDSSALPPATTAAPTAARAAATAAATAATSCTHHFSAHTPRNQEMNQRGKPGAPETSGGGPWRGGGTTREGSRELHAGLGGPSRAPAVERTATLLRASFAETNLPPAIPLSLMSGDLGCCCAFRTLSVFDRHVLLRLLPLQQSVSERAMRLWVSPGSVGELRRALQRLTAAHFIVAMVPPAAAPGAAAHAAAGEQQQGKPNSSTQQQQQQQHQQQQRATQYALTPSFQKALLQLLLEGPPRTPLPFIGIPPRKVFPSKQQLMLHSQRKWEQLLRYVVGASEGGPPGSNSPGGPSADLLKVLRRKSLLCQETFSKGSLLQQQQHQQLLYGGGTALGSNSSGVPGSSSSSGIMQAGGGPEYTMAREAFSWLLKDLKAQLCSLLLEFLYLVDGGLLSNAAHEASLRGSSNPPKHGRRMQSSSSTSINSSSSSNDMDASAEAPAGASAALVEQTQREETLLLLTALIESCVGQPFSLAHLTPPQHRLLNFCVDLGIAYVPPEGAPQGLLASKKNSAKGSTGGKGAPGGGPFYAFAAPYVLLIRRDAYCQKQQQTPQGPLQRRPQVAAPGGPSTLAEGANAEGTGGPIQSDAASVMEGPFHPWLQADDLVVVVCAVCICGSREGGASGWASRVPSRASAFGSLGLQPRILVETNFKVYMYTCSPLHISVLAHLCELTARLPNLVVGLLTRASVLGALKAGITAEQIIGFLEAHAHQVALEKKNKHNRPLIPENVAIQLRMWEQERQRLTLCPAVVFKGWDAALLPELFQRSVRWAVAKGCALHYTMWPEDPNSVAFKEWMAGEKYLAVHADARADIVARIRDVRDELLAQRAGVPLRPAS
ncbi:hypothetical protein ACSSS7_000691 [Eimeria intestinalis]